MQVMDAISWPKDFKECKTISMEDGRSALILNWNGVLCLSLFTHFFFRLSIMPRRNSEILQFNIWARTFDILEILFPSYGFLYPYFQFPIYLFRDSKEILLQFNIFIIIFFQLRLVGSLLHCNSSIFAYSGVMWISNKYLTSYHRPNSNQGFLLLMPKNPSAN